MTNIGSDTKSTLTLRNAQFDFLRVLACFAVITAHVAAIVVFTNPALTNPSWWIGDFYDAAMRWCVPVFIMLTGALLIPKARKLTVLQFWRQKLPRIIIPALFWSCFYILVSLTLTHHMERIGFLLVAAGDEPFFHLWYFYFAILLYVLLPFFQRILDYARATTIAAIVVVSFIISTVAGWPGFAGRYIPFTGPAFVSYLAIGHLLNQLPKPKPRTFGLFAILGATCVVVSGFWAAQLLPEFSYLGWDYVFSFSNALVAITSICVFRIFTSIKSPGNFSSLSKLTLGIYAIHPIWLVTLSKFGISGFTGSPAIGIPLSATLIFILSALTVYALSTIKLLRPVLN